MEVVAIRPAGVGHSVELFDQVREVVLCNIVLSHPNLVAFGLVCKGNDAYLRATALGKNKHIKDIVQKSSSRVDLNTLKWHGYGSKGTYKGILPDVENSSIMTGKKLILAQVQLCDEGGVRECYGEWPNFEKELSFKPMPYYKGKQLCFYGQGWVSIPQHNVNRNVRSVLCYKSSISLYKVHNPEAKNVKVHGSYLQCKLCFKQVNNNYHTEALISLVDYPHILKAICDCPKMTVKKESDYNSRGYFEPQGSFCQWDLESITLPDNYQKFVHSGEYSRFSTFETLPCELKNAFIRRYEEQQKKS
jgi:hypothetical protein